MQSTIMSRVLEKITEVDVNSYQKDGAICIRKLLTLEEVELIRNGIDMNLKELSPRAKVVSKKEDPGLFVEDFCNWQKNPSYKRFIFESPIGAVAGRLMKSSQSRLYHDHILVKEPFTKQKTPWHQDQPYYNINGRQNCSMWIAVDPVPNASTLEFVAGSHLGPWLVPRSFMDNQAKWFRHGSLAELPDIEAARENYPIIGWEVEPGDVVCFHMLTLHAAAGINTDQRRRVFSVRFLGDDITHAPRCWTTSPDFPGLAQELPAGAPMEHLLFPVLWQQPALLNNYF